MPVRKKKVLIVDPSAVFRRALKEVIHISREEVDILEARDAPGALSVAGGSRPDVAFVEIALPGGNGFELIEAMRSVTPATRIVVLTSDDSNEYREASIRKGAANFLSKESAGGLRLLEVIDEALR